MLAITCTLADGWGLRNNSWVSACGLFHWFHELDCCLQLPYGDLLLVWASLTLASMLAGHTVWVQQIKTILADSSCKLV